MKFKDVMTVDEAVAIATKHPFATAATVMKLQAEIEAWRGAFISLQEQNKTLAKYNAELASIFSKESADLQDKIDKLTLERDRLLTENREMKEDVERTNRIAQDLQDDVDRANEAVKHQTALAERYKKRLNALCAPTSDEWVVTYSNGTERQFPTDAPLDLIVEYAEDASKFCGQITKIERR